jgi:hypothetical protein
LAQISTFSSFLVLRVVNLLPQEQVTSVTKYWGWIFSFMAGHPVERGLLRADVWLLGKPYFVPRNRGSDKSGRGRFVLRGRCRNRFACNYFQPAM